MNNWLLTLFVASARESVQGRTVAACSYYKPILSFSLDRSGRAADSGGERLYLTSILSRSGSFIFLAAADPLAGWPVGDIFPQLKRCMVASFEQVRGDRIARLRLAREGREDFTLDLTLYSGAGDATLSTDGRQIATFNRRIHRRSPPAQPATGPIPFTSISQSALESALDANTQIPGLDSTLASILRDPAADITSERLITFRETIAQATEPFWLVCPSRPTEAFPVPGPVHTALDGTTRIGPFGTTLTAVATIGRLLIAKEHAVQIEQRIKPLKALIAKKRSLLNKLREEKASAEAHGTVRKQAETLAAYQSRIPPGSSRIELPDPYGGGHSITIALDSSRPVQHQIERLFKKASKLKRSLPLLEGKIAEIRKTIETLETELAAIFSNRNSTSAFEAIDATLKKYHLSRANGGAARPAEKQYRRYDLDPMWFVLVGRNNRENDELTFRVAAPSDYWFHAQQIPGSHVILKSNGCKTNPPEAILETAASIAAYYSKAKHSSIVPVVYALRKYVRKPRKAKPGQVICSQEKTIFVTPALP